MKLSTVKIKDGINLNIISTDAFKTSQLAFDFLMHINSDNASLNALLFSVLLRGSENYPSIPDVAKKLQSLYDTSVSVTNYKRGETQVFGLYSNFIESRYSLDESDIFADAAEMLGELLFRPLTEGESFKSEYVESEKSNLADRIDAKINNKTQYSFIRCVEIMCPDEDYSSGELGTKEKVLSITPGSLFRHYLRVINEAQLEIYYVGSDDPEKVIKTVSDMISAYGLDGRKEELSPTSVIRNCKSSKRVKEHAEVEQTNLIMGFRTGIVLSDPDFFKFSLFNEIFGGGTTSKLFMNVREKLSLCYFCQSFADSQKGVMFVASGVDEDKVDSAESEILSQLESIRNGDISEAEYEGAVKSLCNSYRSIYDSPDLLESWFVNRNIAGLSETPEEYAEKIKKVTVSDISDIARRISLDTVYTLSPDNEVK